MILRESRVKRSHTRGTALIQGKDSFRYALTFLARRNTPRVDIYVGVTLHKPRHLEQTPGAGTTGRQDRQNMFSKIALVFHRGS
jgi:hypothetical protein